MKRLLIYIVFSKFLLSIYCDLGGILQIHYPHISIETDHNGNITLQSGENASVYIVPGPDGGSVYYEGEDILHLIKIINGLPPVWKEHSSVGFIKTVFGEDTVNVKLEALDPENRPLKYTLVAGTMPPGLTIDSANSRIIGKVPDVDAIYSFTIRATNQNDKYADADFRVEIIERNQCITNNGPCQNGGFCIDRQGDVPYTCSCPKLYSGINCEIDCRYHSLGVTNTNVIPDAMMSAFLTKDNFAASDGRLDSSSGRGMGWCGTNGNSWLQIDFGRRVRIYAATAQSYNSTYYTGSYFATYSIDGFNFYNVTQYSTNSTTNALFSGSSSSTHVTTNLTQPITVRFVRFHPVSYSSSNFPCLRIDLNGCYID